MSKMGKKKEKKLKMIPKFRMKQIPPQMSETDVVRAKLAASYSHKAAGEILKWYPKSKKRRS